MGTGLSNLINVFTHFAQMSTVFQAFSTLQH